jgi:HK97 family phage major capsid protein
MPRASEQRHLNAITAERTELEQAHSIAAAKVKRATEKLAEARSSAACVIYGDVDTRAERPGDDIGRQLRDAIGEVLDGRQTATVELRTVTEGGAGGYGVPIDFRPPVTNLLADSIVMSLPGVRVDAVNSDRVRYPRLGNVTVAAVAEAAALAAGASDLDAVDVPQIKYGVVDYLSSELIEDASFVALQAFGGNLLRNLAAAVDNALLEGLGGTDALGIRNIPGASSTSQANLPTDFSKFRDAEYSLRNSNAHGAVWVMHPRTWNVLAKIVTGITSDKTTLIAPDPREATGSALFGYPVRLSSQFTLTEGATSIGSWAALLDTSQIIVTERRAPTLEVSRDFAFDTDRVAVRATWRGGLAVLNPEAISLVTDVRAA